VVLVDTDLETMFKFKSRSNYCINKYRLNLHCEGKKYRIKDMSEGGSGERSTRSCRTSPESIAAMTGVPDKVVESVRGSLHVGYKHGESRRINGEHHDRDTSTQHGKSTSGKETRRRLETRTGC
jgi:hypothetical protein